MLLLGSSKEDLGKSRVDVHHPAQLADGGLAAHQRTHLLHHVGAVRPEGMTSNYLPCVGLREELQHALGLTHGQCLAVGTIESLPAFVVAALLLQLVLRQPYAGSLRRSEDGGGNDELRRVGERSATIPLLQDMLHYNFGLSLCCMGKHLAAIAVADGIDAVHGGLKMVIDMYACALVEVKAGVAEVA